MAIPLEILTAEVLNLPPQERSQLFDRLLESLEPVALDPDWERAWEQEMDQREADIAAGRAQWVSGDDVIAGLRARLK